MKSSWPHDGFPGRPYKGSWVVGTMFLFLPLMVFVVLMGASPAVSAPYRAAIILDAQTGQVLRQENADRVTYPASLTKMMTLYLVFDALQQGRLKKAQLLSVSATAARQPPSSLGLRRGDKITVEQAVLALIVKSANDAATVLAESLAPSEREFARMMTGVAREIGMKGTSFKNASGLGDGAQKSTARDMALLALALYRHYPRDYSYFSARSFSYGGRTFYTHNHFLDSYPGADGFKTGYIRASGYNLVAAAAQGEHRVVGVLLGGRSAAQRDREMKHLVDYAFLKLTQGKMPVVAAGTSASLTAHRHQTAPIKNLGTWGIQVGAFKAPGEALRVAETCQQEFSSLAKTTPHITTVTKAGSLFHRARLVGLSRVAAQRTCDALKARGRDCFLVPPQQLAKL